MNKAVRVLFLITGALTMSFSCASAAVTCIEAPGEAAIKGTDLHSAREEAQTRAKWHAIESVSGIDMHGDRVLQNMRVVDEAVIRKFDGIIEKSEVLRETVNGESVKVTLRVCVEGKAAHGAMESLSLNQSITLITPVKTLAACTGFIRDEENDFTASFTGSLIDKGYRVRDVLSDRAFSYRSVDASVKTGRFKPFKDGMYRYFSNILVIGMIDQSEGKAEGEDIGFGLEMPGNLVRSRLLYKIVRKNDADMTVLSAGVETGKGFGHDPCEAARNSLSDLADNAAASVARKLNQHVAGLAKKVTIRVMNIADLNMNFAVKAVLQNTAWVEAVEEQSLGEFIVTYREKAVYLANSLVQKGNIRLISFSPETITINFEY